jgi:hypothetical protein
MENNEQIAEAIDKFAEFVNLQGVENTIMFYSYTIGNERYFGCSGGSSAEQIGILEMMKNYILNE